MARRHCCSTLNVQATANDSAVTVYFQGVCHFFVPGKVISTMVVVYV